MLGYLIDTCTVSDLFKKTPKVIERFKKISPDLIGISAITFMEIEYRLILNPKQDVKIRPIWQEFLNYINIIPFTEKCAKQSAIIREHLKQRGLPIGPYDILIAGTCLAHESKPTLVTSNMKEFNRIPGLNIEDWHLADKPIIT